MDTLLKVLAIDDDVTQLELLKLYCSAQEYPQIEYFAAEDMKDGEAILKKQPIDLVLTDYYLPDGSGLDVLKSVKALNPLVSVVIMTAYESARNAVDLLMAGADDYLIKPTSEKDIAHLCVRVAEQQTAVRESTLIRQQIEETLPAENIIYRSQAMTSVLQTVARCAGSDATVLIASESGTGKELVARLLHSISKRKDAPFITVNISALPESLVESELFGYKKGSFTGAAQDRIGRFEQAAGGTVFIDEIGDVSPVLQVKLLRVIQFGEIERIGENATRALDVRIIAATNRDLKKMVRENTFRSDLYYRLNVIPIVIPPLRDRKDDIPALIDYFIARFNERNGKHVKGASREAMEALMRYDFPGNIRELENLIERGVILCRSEYLRVEDFPDLVSVPTAETAYCPEPEGDYDSVMDEFEKKLLKKAFDTAGGNQSEAARLLSISERRFRSRLQHLREKGVWD
jgi:DNA-binding NtrC family response regulator